MINAVTADISYADFRKSYTPTNKLKDPNNKAVQIVGFMDAATLAPIMEEYAKDKDKKMFDLIITSIPREKAGEVINKMNLKLAIKGINLLGAEWQKEIMWYVPEGRFNAMSGKVGAFK